MALFQPTFFTFSVNLIATISLKWGPILALKHVRRTSACLKSIWFWQKKTENAPAWLLYTHPTLQNTQRIQSWHFSPSGNNFGPDCFISGFNLRSTHLKSSFDSCDVPISKEFKQTQTSDTKWPCKYKKIYYRYRRDSNYSFPIDHNTNTSAKKSLFKRIPVTFISSLCRHVDWIF